VCVCVLISIPLPMACCQVPVSQAVFVHVVYSSALNMEATGSSEILVTI
jgi:hypothetical protein